MSLLTVYVQVSCLLIQNAGTQMPIFGYPQYPQQQPNLYILQPHQPMEKDHRSHRKNTYHQSSSEEHSDNEDECVCENDSCDDCEEFPIENSCCVSFCDSCLANNQGNNGKVVIVPYPYPMVVAVPSKSTEATTEATTTECTKPSVREPNSLRRVIPRRIRRRKPEPEPELELETESMTETEPTPESTPKPKLRLKSRLKPKPKRKPKRKPKPKPKPKPSPKTTEIPTTTENSPKIEISNPPYRDDSQLETFEPIKLRKMLVSPKQIIKKPGEYNDIIYKAPENGSTKYILTSLRRVKQNWMPKYGIVPIPDDVATNLMTQLKTMKVLQAQRDLGIESTEKPTPLELLEKIYGRS